MSIKFLDRATKQPVSDGIVYVDRDVVTPAPTPAQVKAFTSMHVGNDLAEWNLDPAMQVAAVDVIDHNGKMLPNPRGANAPHTYIYRQGGALVTGIDQLTGAAAISPRGTTFPKGAKIIFKAFDDAGNVIDTKTVIAGADRVNL